MEIRQCVKLPSAHKYKQLSKLELNEHYRDILNETHRWRNCSIHFNNNPHDIMNVSMNSSMYFHTPPEATWIENMWITHYMKLIDDVNDVTEVFPGGVIPLFIQWMDCHYDSTFDHNRSHYLWKDLKNALRRDILYVTVSQNARGLMPNKNYRLTIPNIFAFSAGGYGHAPIPLLRPVAWNVTKTLCGGVNELPCAHTASFMGGVNKSHMRQPFELVMTSATAVLFVVRSALIGWTSCRAQ
jgi:hypothetical protein